MFVLSAAESPNLSLKATLGFVSATTLVNLDTGHCTVPRGNVISNKKWFCCFLAAKHWIRGKLFVANYQSTASVVKLPTLYVFNYSLTRILGHVFLCCNCSNMTNTTTNNQRQVYTRDREVVCTTWITRAPVLREYSGGITLQRRRGRCLGWVDCFSSV